MAKHIYVIYIGTTKLVALKGSINDDESLSVDQLVKVRNNGFDKGVVINVDQASAQLRKLISKFEPSIDLQKVDFHIVLSNRTAALIISFK